MNQSPLSAVVGDGGEPVSVRLERVDRHRAEVAVSLRVVRRELTLLDAAPVLAVRSMFIAPRAAYSHSASVGRHFTGPPTAGNGIRPQDVGDRMVKADLGARPGAFGTCPARTVDPGPPAGTTPRSDCVLLPLVVETPSEDDEQPYSSSPVVYPIHGRSPGTPGSSRRTDRWRTRPVRRRGRPLAVGREADGLVGHHRERAGWNLHRPRRVDIGGGRVGLGI